MINLLRRNSNKSSKIVIEINRHNVLINGNNVQFPTDWKVLKQHFGTPNDTKGNEIIWKDLGISTNPHKNGTTTHLSCHTDFNPMESKSKAEQKPFFRGKIYVDGKEINQRSFKEITMRKYEVKHFTYTGKENPCLISISYNPTYDKDVIKPPPSKDKYLIKKLDEEQIEFADLGFKISIIQELMYHKEILKPKFELHEFVKWYDKRKIDLEKEGYQPIPEVTQYFKDLPIAKSLAAEITEIYQDGGNAIYLQLLRFGEGWETYWDIEKSEDAKNFPNLKKMTLCYAKENVMDEFNAMGIEAKWI